MSKRKYENRSEKVTWFGAPTKKDQNSTYYSSFNGNGEKYSIGDNAYVYLGASNYKKKLLGPPDGFKDCGIVEIVKLWEDQYQVKWFEARWLYYPEDLVGGRKQAHGVMEVFETSHMDELEVISIEAKVDIVTFEAFEALMDEEARESTFYCRNFYDIGTKITRPIVNGKKNGSQNNVGDLYSTRDSRQEELCAPTIIEKRSDNMFEDEEMEGNKFQRACNLLQASHIPATIPCRESEREQIMTFLATAVEKGSLGCALYISGLPGTGKTATVKEVIRSLRKMNQNGKLPGFHFIEINAMKLDHPHSAYTKLWKEICINDEKDAKNSKSRKSNKYKASFNAVPKRAVQLLDDRFNTKDSERKCTVVLVDELDYLVTKTQTVLYNMFEWPTKPHGRLIVVGIANTMNLPERLLPRISSRLGIGRIVFEPYNRENIQKIIAVRCEETEVFDEGAIQLCARKVAGVSGDIRHALMICRRAAELCDQSGGEFVDTLLIQKAAAELSQSHTIKSITSEPLYSKLLIWGVAKAQESVGLHYAHLADVYRRFGQFCRNRGDSFTPDKTQVLDMIKRLQEMQLITFEENKRDKIVSLNVQIEDIQFALKDDKDIQAV